MIRVERLMGVIICDLGVIGNGGIININSRGGKGLVWCVYVYMCVLVFEFGVFR